MSYTFIGGIPTAGKSYLAAKIEKEKGIRHFKIDDWREEIKDDPAFKPWVNLFLDKNEEEYWNTINREQQWEHLRLQSEALWPAILERINRILQSGTPAIFEGVNILPHLARRDLKFEGILLLGRSFEETFERNVRAPRWGLTKDLQRKEAEAFWNWERPRYEEEAKRYNYKTFADPYEAEQELIKLLHV